MDKKLFKNIVEAALLKLEEKIDFEMQKLKNIVNNVVDALDEETLNKMRSTPGHEIDHTIRVLTLATYLGLKLGADINVIIPCSLLHDISRLIDPKVENHATKSAEIAKKYIKNKFPRDIVNKIINCIQEHSYSAKVKPTSLESMIVQDADKLDALGLIGVARVFAYGGALGRPIADPINISSNESSLAHFYEKILRLGDLLNTELAKEIASRKLSKVIEFVREFERELESFGLCDVV